MREGEAKGEERGKVRLTWSKALPRVSKISLVYSELKRTCVPTTKRERTYRLDRSGVVIEPFLSSPRSTRIVQSGGIPALS